MNIHYTLFFFSCFTFPVLKAQHQVEANFNVRHQVGTVDSFDRAKFINFHATYHENYWDSGNAVKALRDSFLVDLDVYLGRDTGGVKWILNGTKQDPKRPGFADPAHIAQQGAKAKREYAAKKQLHPYEKYSNLIICNQFHPFYPDGTAMNRVGWAFSQADTPSEPFGTAAGEFYGRYIKESFGQGGTTGAPAPKYCEVINEPLWDIWDAPGAPQSSITQLFKFHATVAKEVKKYNPNLAVGGYCTAFPDFDTDNFQRWHDRWKHFIDVAGEEMDYWTIHLYDFPAIGGKERYRKGSNMEATMDMLEQYSMMRLGEVKPLMISEYNAQTHDYTGFWSPYRDWLRLKSTNSMLMQFMERANHINIAMPFFMLRCDWGYNASTGRTHDARMLRRQNEPESYTGDFVYTDLIKFFQLWKDVKGTRVDTHTDHLDLICDAYVDGNKAYLIINNLDFNPIHFDLDINGIAQGASSIELRHLHLQGGKGGKPVLEVKEVDTLDEFTLDAEATVIIVYTYPDPVVIDQLNEEIKYYASEYLKPIQANQALTFQLNQVQTGGYGEAVLRLGVGRNHGLSIRPKVQINGKPIEVPNNHRGDNQEDRSNFFGVLEIPFDYDLLQTNNEVEVTFPESGGHLSTVTMQVYHLSVPLRPDLSSGLDLNTAPSFGVYHDGKSLQISGAQVGKTHTYRVYRSSGELLHQGEFKGATLECPLTLPAGVYLLEVDGQCQKFPVSKG